MHICGPSVIKTSGEKIKSCFNQPKLMQNLWVGAEVQSFASLEGKRKDITKFVVVVVENRVHSLFISQIREALELTGHCRLAGH